MNWIDLAVCQRNGCLGGFSIFDKTLVYQYRNTAAGNTVMRTLYDSDSPVVIRYL